MLFNTNIFLSFISILSAVLCRSPLMVWLPPLQNNTIIETATSIFWRYSLLGDCWHKTPQTITLSWVPAGRSFTAAIICKRLRVFVFLVAGDAKLCGSLSFVVGMESSTFATHLLPLPLRIWCLKHSPCLNGLFTPQTTVCAYRQYIENGGEHTLRSRIKFFLAYRLERADYRRKQHTTRTSLLRDLAVAKRTSTNEVRVSQNIRTRGSP